ncbi:MAG: porin family protein [Candidatus Cyclobacteriaceae bacterium M2_1C_046]
MKKILTTLILTLFALGAYAQIGAGAKVGVNFANQDIEGINTESTTGYHFGAYFTFGISENFALQPEILFSKQGAELSYSSITREVDYSYLTIPVLLRFNIMRVLNLHAGPQFNILSRAELEESGTMAKEEITDQLNSLDFALAFGGGVNLPKNFHLGLRYVISITDINETFNPSNVSIDPEIKNKTLQLYLGYRFFGE